MFGFGKKKKLHEMSRQTISQFHGWVQGQPAEVLGELLDTADRVRFDMSMTDTAREAEKVFTQFFENPFSMQEQQLHAMLDWCTDVSGQFKGQGDMIRLSGLSVWVCNGVCAAHTDLIPLGSALWKDLVRGKEHSHSFEWEKYELVLKQFGANVSL